MSTRRSRREAAHGRNEMLGMLVSCIGCAAILTYISPHLLLGPFGIVLSVGAALASMFAIIFHIRQGGSVAGALVWVLLTGGVTAGLMVGIWWYFFVYLASQPTLFNFGTSAQSQPSQAGTAFAVPEPDARSNQAEAMPTVVPAPSPMPGAICGSAIVQGVEALALRAEPTRSSQQLAAIERGKQVELLCAAPIQADGREWYNVRSGNTEGWMSARYLHIQ